MPDSDRAKWYSHKFSPREVELWLDAGCWDADIAAAFRDAGVAPETAWHVLNPISSVRADGMSINDLIEIIQRVHAS
jgi:hypothetical protein